jgi:glycosyltransferase involved in cell wall biosynthesis
MIKWAMAAADELVSIIIPSYNYGKYLPDAIESALCQTYSKKEIIVVDDGSTDGSPAIARIYGKRIRLIELPHVGLSAAFMAGVEKSNGKYILNLNSDDILCPDYLAKTIAIIDKERHTSFVYTGFSYFGAEKYRYETEKYDRKRLTLYDYIPSTILVKKVAFLEAGGYDPNIPLLEDWDFLLSLTEKGHEGIALNEPLFHYRLHGGQSRNNKASVIEYAKTRAAIASKHRMLINELSFFEKMTLVLMVVLSVVGFMLRKIGAKDSFLLKCRKALVALRG